MGWNPCQSLKGFATSQPPLLMFTICLMAFGIVMVMLAYIVGVSEVPNPDVMDWNKFLDKLTELDMCIPKKYVKNVTDNKKINLESGSALNSHFFTNMTNNSSVLRFVNHRNSLSAVLSNVVDSVADDTVDDDAVVNVSVKIHVWISGRMDILSSLPSLVHGSITGKQLGLKGKQVSQSLNVTFHFPSLSNISCKSWCHVFKEVCLTVQVSTSLLPHTKSPKRCENIENLIEDAATVDFAEEWQISAGKSCQDKAHLHLQYVPDSELTEMLSMTERSIVNLHLMHTSYFMFVMVITLLCYVLIRGRYPATKSTSGEKLLLDT